MKGNSNDLIVRKEKKEQSRREMKVETRILRIRKEIR